MAPAEEFEQVSAADVKKMTTTARSKEIDPVWAERIGTLGIGQGFKTQRKDTETVRQFKKRINAAAAASYRTLVWTTLDPKQADGVEPSKFLAKVNAIDTTPRENPASENGSEEGGTSEESSGTSEGEAPTGRRARS